MFAVLASSRCTVSEHSSTATKMPTAAGKPTSMSCIRARPAAPAMHPRPISGTRFTSGRKPTRAAM